MITAVEKGDLKIIKKLLQSGADPSLEGGSYPQKYKPVEYSGDIQIKLLLNSFEKIRSLRKNNESYIFYIPKDLVGLIEDEV